MPYLFRPPTYEVAITDEPYHLMRHYTFNRGYSVRIANDNSVDAYPGVQGILDSDLAPGVYQYVYRGGRKYTISDEEYALLIAADAQWDDHCTEL